MADQISPDQTRSGAPEPQPHVSPVAVGGVVFAVCVLGIIGSFHAIAGLTAILDDNFYQAQNDYPFDFDVNVRGWVQMLTGVLVLAAALNIFSGRTWARAVGIAVAGFSALENFFFTPYYPVWSAIIIALDILVIWSLTMYGHRQAHKVYGAPV
ncbi:membrane protein [Streptomyces durmitorensis]|uniref:DUF7144 domain-containing protein n=1 Tax=Streptomyces durmitorensis TaxID=319947 RepID=A0ABY4Q6Q3_9ACTN|nr:hypothetical protein [Streptomyces durmitorensis]UQT60918.1 hypothetical protein M4V62_40840 [Streptomyces durmitorensis]